MRSCFLFLLVLISCFKNDDEVSNPSPSNIYYDNAFELYKNNNKDSAFLYFTKAKTQYTKTKDSLGIAKCLMNMGCIQSDFGDYFGSLENAIAAQKIFEKIHDTIYIANNYNLLGGNEIRLNNFESSIRYFNIAIKFSNNKSEKTTYSNNKAIAFAKLKQYDSCFNIYKKLLNENIDKPRIIDNYHFYRWKESNNYNAEPYLYYALKLRENDDDLWGQNASQEHLIDYFIDKNKEKALFHARKMYEVTKKINSLDDQLTALQKLILLENTENVKKYFLIYQKLNDSLQTARNKAKNQFALIRYDAEKNRADFLKSEADNSIKENRILRQNIVLGLMGVIFFGGFFWYRKRKKRLEQEKELEVKNTELKFSKKVHDVVANNLYQTMVEVENLPEIDKENLLNKLEKMYEESRDIAHENISDIAQKDFSQKLSEMISSYSSEYHKVFIVGNQEKVWENIPQKVRDELFYVLRELMVNMKKHSEAELISIKFEKNEKKLQIFYTDNGLGISDLEKNKNSGIKNTENRIFMIGGTINFEKNPKGGLLVNILIPINYV